MRRLAGVAIGADLLHETVDPRERGGGALGLPLDAREDRDLDLGVACGHPMIPMMRKHIMGMKGMSQVYSRNILTTS